jgi:PilZ domain
MKSRSNLVERPEATCADIVPRERRPYRQKIRTLAHVDLDAVHGAILRDLNEFGIALQTVVPLAANQQVRVRFELPGFELPSSELPAPRVRIEAASRIAWTDSLGQAGVQFLDLPQRSRRLLKEWIFFQILSAAYLFSPCESEVEGNRAEGASELLFSTPPRPAMQLPPPPSSPVVVPRPQRFRLLWCPVPISLRALSKMLDGLILLCAVLLFAVMALAMTSILPAWPLTLALAMGIAAIFVVLYWFLFVFWIGATPGGRLARLACLDSGGGARSDEVEARFR